MRINQENVPDTVDYGYIIIPTNVDRDDYVNNCLLNERITIVGTGGSSIIHNCYISKNILKEITFPETHEELGDVVIYINNLFNNKPIIIGTISKENDTQLLTEYEFRNRVEYKDNIIDVSGNAKDGSLNINVTSQNDAAFFINVNGENSKFKIKTNGEVSIYGKDKIELLTTKNISLKKFDEGDFTKFSEINIINKDIEITPQEEGKVKIGGEEEQILLGDSTVKELNKELQAVSDIISSITETTPMPVPPNSIDSTWIQVQQKLKIIKTRGNFDKVLSKITYIK